MLRTARQLIIEHKAIFRQAIIAYANMLPEPVIQPTTPQEKAVTWKNSPVLLRIRDKFLSYYGYEGRRQMMEAGWKILIDELEHDPAYRDPFQFLVEELVEAVMNGEWQPRPANAPLQQYWKEPPPYGNYVGRDFARFIKKDGR